MDALHVALRDALMAKKDNPAVIKKYANRRLYHTGTSTYVTLDDLAVMVKAGDDFIVVDAKTGDEITHSVLTQIIFDQENKDGQNMLPVNFLRQLIRFYGDSLQAFVPHYLEVTMQTMSQEQEKLREQMKQAFGASPIGLMEEHVRKNMAFMNQAFRMFTPFSATTGGDSSAGSTGASGAAKSSSDEDMLALRKQLVELNQRLSALEKT
jgi:polyhydroxyalkanoate synthesis repressor PhaR